MRIGGYDIAVLNAGFFKLDGGGMFGVVPRAMWQERVQPDEANRIRVSTTCLLLEGHGHRVLIETGCGDKFDAKGRAMYGIDDPRGILGALADFSARSGRPVPPESIDAVICSHLHFDHGGGLTTLGPDDKPTPAFPNARLFVQRREWEDAVANFSHMRTTYLPENIGPVAERVAPVAGPADVLPNIRVEPAPGHTLGSQVVLVGDAELKLCFIGDLVPTRHHLRPYWTMSYDIEPATTIATRAKLIGRAIQERWIIVYPHDDQVAPARVKLDAKGRWEAEGVES